MSLKVLERTFSSVTHGKLIIIWCKAWELPGCDCGGREPLLWLQNSFWGDDQVSAVLFRLPVAHWPVCPSQSCEVVCPMRGWETANLKKILFVICKCKNCFGLAGHAKALIKIMSLSWRQKHMFTLSQKETRGHGGRMGRESFYLGLAWKYHAWLLVVYRLSQINNMFFLKAFHWRAFCQSNLYEITKTKWGTVSGSALVT